MAKAAEAVTKHEPAAVAKQTESNPRVTNTHQPQNQASSTLNIHPMPIKSILKKNTKNFSTTNNAGHEFISNFAK